MFNELDLLEAEPLSGPLVGEILGAAPELTEFNKQTFAKRKEQILQLKTHPRAELRNWAKKQIDTVKVHYDSISWLSKHTPVLSAKYNAMLSSLDTAQAQFTNAEEATNEQKSNGLYVLALLNATEAAGSLAEAEQTALSDDLVELISTGVKEEATALTQFASEVAKSAGAGVASALGIPTWVFWAGGAALLVATGFGAWKILTIVAPVAVNRYLHRM